MIHKNVVEQFPRQAEGRIAKALETQTSRVPSDVFLWGALSALGLGFIMQLRQRREAGAFITQLAPVFLILGLYNKLVKVTGHDRKETEV
ncbi:MAG: hypothetical protein HY553_05110 [Elusimicrobia bacterium]|nr:hypothetical protein [Elusimicrobiota bacterium]